MECAFIKSDVCDTGYFASPVELGVSNATASNCHIKGVEFLVGCPFRCLIIIKELYHSILGCLGLPSQVAHQMICSMKELGVFLLPPG